MSAWKTLVAVTICRVTDEGICECGQRPASHNYCEGSDFAYFDAELQRPVDKASLTVVHSHSSRSCQRILRRAMVARWMSSS